jgi:hypothetical protein
MLALKNLDTLTVVKMKVEEMEKLIFTKVHFNMNVALEKGNERERGKARKVYDMAQKISPLRRSWGEAIPIGVELNFK